MEKQSAHYVRLLGLSVALSAVAVPQSWAAKEEVLTVEGFLSQVRGKNDAVKAAVENREGAKARANDANLMFTPSLNFDMNLVDDRKRGLLFPFSRTVTDTATLSINNQFSLTGTQARVGYTQQYFEYYFMSPTPPTTKTYLGTPFIEIRQPLWRNFLGSEARALRDVNAADAMAKHYEETFRLKGTLAGAESAYWRLAVARQWVKVQKDAIARAQKIHDYNEKRSKLQLADKADVFQSTALLQLRKLELQAASDEERSARIAFNSARGLPGQDVSESLVNLDSDAVLEIHTPTRAGLREDVLAAQERQKQARAAATLGKEKNRPTFEIFGNYSVNAYTGHALDAFGNAFSANQPMRVVGVKFSMPLDVSSTSSSVDGYGREQVAAELNATRKVFEQEQEWNDLNQKSEEAQRRLKLARAIEEAQEKKLSYERDRLNRGRSTMVQVSLFEQDYSQSQLSRMRAQAEVLTLNSQLKTFSELK